ncbi:MAG: hypothetical protein RR420_05445 [Anaerovoracaceae bacterium]
MNNNNKNFEFLDIVNIVQLALSIANYQQNKAQTTNDQIMKELNLQDDTYFKKIIENQEKIMKELNIHD